MSDQNPRKSVSGRSVAVKALGKILTSGDQLEASLLFDPDFKSLEPRDRAFARLLLTTALRHLGQIDFVLKDYLARNPPPFVMNAMRIASGQILVLGNADHAAVGEMVGLVKSHRNYPKFSGLVNAILRRVSQEGRAKMATIAPRENIPAWIYKSWERNFGRAAARLMSQEYLKTPPLDITVKSDPHGWAEKLGGTVIFGNTVRLNNAGRVTELEGFNRGEWWVQDLSSTLPVTAIQDVLGDINGLSVLDMCAAPGGKTLQLAHAGAKVTAIDRSSKRLELLNDNLRRTKLDVSVIEADALTWTDGDQSYDVVLLDAPCSATGTFRRHPDVLRSKSQEQMAKLTKLQRSLILSAVKKLRPGGLLVYCTCSLQVEEGEEQKDWFLHKQNDFEVIRFSDEKWREFGNSGGHLQIREKGGLDGFFIALFRQKSDSA